MDEIIQDTGEIVYIYFVFNGIENSSSYYVCLMLVSKEVISFVKYIFAIRRIGEKERSIYMYINKSN